MDMFHQSKGIVRRFRALHKQFVATILFFLGASRERRQRKLKDPVCDLDDVPNTAREMPTASPSPPASASAAKTRHW
jgi:hypothetical protein